MRGRGLSASLAVLVGASAWAAPADSRNPYIPVVEVLYRSLEYEEALREMEKANAWPDNSAEERTWLAFMEGVLVMEFNDVERARAAFVRGLQLSPDATLPVDASPKVRETFEKARQEVQRAMPPPAPPPAQPEAPAPPVVSAAQPARAALRLEAGAWGFSDVVARTVAVGADVGARWSDFEARVQVLAGPRVALGLEAAYVLGSEWMGKLGARGRAVPAVGAYGGGVVVGGAWAFSPHAYLFADASAEAFHAPAGYRPFGVMATFGLRGTLALH